MQFRFLHAADIHLDSPCQGLSKYPGLPIEDIRLATRQALENLASEAISLQVSFIVIAGDLSDGDWKDVSTFLFLCAQFARLKEAGIDVFVILGNHDAQSLMTRSIPFPSNVHLFDHRSPETKIHEPTQTAIHGQSYATREMFQNMAANFPAPRAGFFNIGILHTALGGSYGTHANYAPCSVEELAGKRYDYWALGHVHEFKVLHDNPPIVFSGNIQGRHINEVGAKGAVLVEVENGRIVGEPQKIDLDVLRWTTIPVDATGETSMDRLTGQIAAAMSRAAETEADGRGIIARVVIQGTTTLHGDLVQRETQLRDELRAIALNVASNFLIEKVRIRTALPSEEAAAGNGSVDELSTYLTRAKLDPEFNEYLSSELGAFFAKLPPELGEPNDLLQTTRNGNLENLLSDAVAAVQARIKAEG